VGLLGACGGGAEEPEVADQDTSQEESPASAESSAAAEEAEPEAVSIQRQPFCDQVDEALVTQALGARAQWLDERKPGDKYEIFGSKQVSSNFYCRWQTNAEGTPYGPGDATFAMTIDGAELTAAQARARIEERRAATRQDATQECDEAAVPFEADHSYGVVCVVPGNEYNKPAARASVAALFGDALLTCFVERAGKNQLGPTQKAYEDVCAQVPTMLGS
jgi:hypothetical protein